MFREFAGLLKRAGAIAGVASLVAFGGQAQAAQFVGEWDPAFGNPFDISGSRLGWQGTVEFYVPDACLLLTGRIDNQGQQNASNCTFNDPLRLISGTVELYNMDTPTSILGTASFTAGGSSFKSVRVAGGTVTELVADFNQWVFAVPRVPIAGGDLAQYSLSFTGDCAQLTIKYFPVGSTVSSNSNSDPCRGNAGPLLEFRNLSAVIPVPEPGSLALMLSALGLLAFVRRRKSAVA